MTLFQILIETALVAADFERARRRSWYTMFKIECNSSAL